MAAILIYFRVDDTVLDYVLYSRQLAPGRFDEMSQEVVLASDCDTRPKYLALKTTSGPTPACPPLGCSADGANNPRCSGAEEDWRVSVQSPGVGRKNCSPCVALVPLKKIAVSMAGDLASCVSYELARSKTFRARFLKHVVKLGVPSLLDQHMNADFVNGLEIAIPLVVEVTLQWPKQKIDYSWGYRILAQLNKKMHLEESMAWLSTLGGGFSALGDHFIVHAEKAGKIAIEQLKIAIELGDPMTAVRCWLYIALSMLQRGIVKQSKIIIRMQYKFARCHIVKDDQLINMCFGVWNRLIHLLQQKKTSRDLPNAALS